MTTTFADKATRLDDIRAELDTAVAGLASPEAWKSFLDFADSFHRYSFNNTILIALQLPGATQVASFKKWQEHGRLVRKGEKALWVLAPLPYKRTVRDKDTGDETEVSGIRGFKPVPVFDVSQTDGEALPEPPVRYAPVNGQIDPAVVAELTAKIVALGFRVEYRELAGPEGHTLYDAKLVEVDPSTSPANQARVLAHELAHIVLGHEHRHGETTKSDREVEAESVTYVLGRRYGIPGADSSFAYLAGWAHGETDKLKAAANNVLAAARTILDEPQVADHAQAA